MSTDPIDLDRKTYAVGDNKIRLTEEMARAMLATAPKFKPVYVIRAFKMESDFELIWPGVHAENTTGKAGDYITIDGKDMIHVVEGAAVESNFKPIPPRKPRVTT